MEEELLRALELDANRSKEREVLDIASRSRPTSAHTSRPTSPLARRPSSAQPLPSRPQSPPRQRTSSGQSPHSRPQTGSVRTSLRHTSPPPSYRASDAASSTQQMHHYLSKRISVMQDEVVTERNSRFDTLLGKMRMLDDRMIASSDHNSKKFMVLKDMLVKFDKELTTEQQCREKFVGAQEAEIVRVDVEMQASLLAEQTARRASEERILSIFESKTTALKDDINSSTRARAENEAHLRRYLEEDIPKLYENLKTEVSNREAMEQRMLSKAMDEVTQLQAAILEEKKAREDTEEAMLRMMEDVVFKTNNEIAREREERERMEMTLMALLHDTSCGKTMPM